MYRTADPAEYLTREVDRVRRVFYGELPPNRVQRPAPGTDEEIFGFPRGTSPWVIARYLGDAEARGSIGRELLNQRHRRDLATMTHAHERQMRAHRAARAEGAPSPGEVLRFIRKWVSKNHGEVRGSRKAAAKEFELVRQRITQILTIVRACRVDLEHLAAFCRDRQERDGTAHYRKVSRRITRMLLVTSLPEEATYR